LTQIKGSVGVDRLRKGVVSIKDRPTDKHRIVTQANPQICVVVPTFNAADDIAACLGALLDADFKASEIVVSDDGSSDATIAVSLSLGIPTLVSETNTGAAQARNRGVAATQSELILFVDADVEVDPDVRQKVLNRFAQEPELDALFGSYCDQPTRPEPISRVRNLLHHHVHQQNAGPSPSFWTGLGAIRRSVFEAVGQFDPEIPMMEDIEYGMRLYNAGYRAELDPTLQGTHRKHWSLWQMLKTDLMDRAMPWTQLMRSEKGRRVPESLNVSRAGKMSVIASGTSLIGLAAVLFLPKAGLAIIATSLATLFFANRTFLGKVYGLDGPRQAVLAFAILWLHYGCAGLGYTLVRLGFRV
jgi:GT2 family glycosyltransferase